MCFTSCFYIINNARACYYLRFYLLRTYLSALITSYHVIYFILPSLSVYSAGINPFPDVCVPVSINMFLLTHPIHLPIYLIHTTHIHTHTPHLLLALLHVRSFLCSVFSADITVICDFQLIIRRPETRMFST